MDGTKEDNDERTNGIPEGRTETRKEGRAEGIKKDRTVGQTDR